MSSITDLLNPQDSIKKFRPTEFTTAGLSSNVDKKGNVTLNRSAELNSTLDQIAAAYAAQGGNLADIRSQVTPGISRLTTEAVSALDARRNSVLDQLNNRRRKAIGDLRDNLSRRRIAGSSFAADAVARNEAEFLQQQKDIESQFGTIEAEFKQRAFLQEVEISTNLINQEAQANVAQFQTYLNQFNFEAGLAAQLSSSNSQIMAQNAQALAALNTQILTAGGKAVGGAISGGPSGPNPAPTGVPA